MPGPLDLTVSIKFKQTGLPGNSVDFYDGTEALHGFAKSLLLTTHYYLNGKVAFQAPSARGVRILMLPAKKGSFDQVVKFVLENPELSIFAVTTLGWGFKVTAPSIFKFAKYVFARTAGRAAVADDKATQEILATRENDIPALSEAIDGPLRQAHRTIDQSGGSVVLSRPGGTSLTFDAATLDYLKTRVVDRVASRVEGSVVAYNVLSGRGRIYLTDEGRTVPFEKDKDAPRFNSRALSWSLDQRNRGRPGYVYLVAKKSSTIDGEVKKFIVSNCGVV